MRSVYLHSQAFTASGIGFSPCDITKVLACFLPHSPLYQPQNKELYWHCLVNILAYSPWTEKGFLRSSIMCLPSVHLILLVSFTAPDLLGLLPQWPNIIFTSHFVGQSTTTFSVAIIYMVVKAIVSASPACQIIQCCIERAGNLTGLAIQVIFSLMKSKLRLFDFITRGIAFH